MRLILLLFTLMTNVCYGTTTLAHLAESDINYFRAGDSTTKYLEMVFEASSGGGTVESSPHKVYVPLNDLTVTVDQANNNILSDSSAMPSLSTGDVLSTYLRTLVVATNTAGEDEKVYVAFKGSSSSSFTQAVPGVTTTQYDTTNNYWEVVINLETLCTATYKPQECTDLKGSADGSKAETFTFYVWSTTLDLSANDGATITVSDSGYTGGIFYQVNISDAIPVGTQTLSSIEKGDTRLTLNVTGGNSVTNMTTSIAYRSVVFSGVAGGQSAQSANVTNIIQNDTIVKEGKIDVKNLTNGTTYQLSTALVNKYQFSTTTSNALSEAPLEIEALLKSQACYLVTAGFQRKHYVLDYFRAIRDNYLLKFAPTKKLVDLYYASAPKYAPVIYNSPKLSLVVRSMSYGVYFFLKFFWYIFGLGLILLGFRFRNFRLNIAS